MTSTFNCPFRLPPISLQKSSTKTIFEKNDFKCQSLNFCSSDRFTDLDKLNLVKVGFGFEPIVATALATSKMTIVSKLFRLTQK